MALDGITNELIGEMRTWIKDIEQYRAPSTCRILKPWYDAVIAPLGIPIGSSSILAPALALHLLPFAAARAPDDTYLIDQYTLGIVPSLGALWIAYQQAMLRPRTTQSTLLSVAYPGREPHYLPGVLTEAQAIMARFAGHATALHNEDARREAVIAKTTGTAYVHVGSHGMYHPDRPERSGLMLAEGDWLTVSDIITEMNLATAHMFTMAACETSQAAYTSGGELTGLVQAGLTAGAPVVVASQWCVNDAVTAALFQSFYAHTTAGQAPALAMRTAMDEIRQQRGCSHPYYWAAFTV